MVALVLHVFCFFTFPLFFSPRSLQSSELDDILNDLQNAQPQLFCELRPVSLPSPMDKQNIINDILQMSETNPAAAAQQQHRNMAGVGPTSKSHISVEMNSLALRVDCDIATSHCWEQTPFMRMLGFKGVVIVLHICMKLTNVCLQTSELSDQARQAGVCLWGACLWTWTCPPSSPHYSTPSGPLAHTLSYSSSKAWWEVTAWWLTRPLWSAQVGVSHTVVTVYDHVGIL